MPGYDLTLRSARTRDAPEVQLRLPALSQERAVLVAELRYGGEVVQVRPLAYCPMCNGFAELDAKPRRHQIPGCRGRWEIPE